MTFLSVGFGERPPSSTSNENVPPVYYRDPILTVDEDRAESLAAKVCRVRTTPLESSQGGSCLLPALIPKTKSLSLSHLEVKSIYAVIADLRLGGRDRDVAAGALEKLLQVNSGEVSYGGDVKLVPTAARSVQVWRSTQDSSDTGGKLLPTSIEQFDDDVSDAEVSFMTAIDDSEDLCTGSKEKSSHAQLSAYSDDPVLSELLIGSSPVRTELSDILENPALERARDELQKTAFRFFCATRQCTICLSTLSSGDWPIDYYLRAESFGNGKTRLKLELEGIPPVTEQLSVACLPCGHKYCRGCFTKYLQTRAELGYGSVAEAPAKMRIRCPLCRRKVKATSVSYFGVN